MCILNGPNLRKLLSHLYKPLPNSDFVIFWAPQIFIDDILEGATIQVLKFWTTKSAEKIEREKGGDLENVIFSLSQNLTAFAHQIRISEIEKSFK